MELINGVEHERVTDLQEGKRLVAKKTQATLAARVAAQQEHEQGRGIQR